MRLTPTLPTADGIPQKTGGAARPRWTAPPALVVLAIALWSVLAAVSAAKAYSRPGVHSTYLYYPRAAQHWWADEDLYSPNYKGFDPYRYSPAFAVLATPFGMVSDRIGGVLWAVGSVALLFFALSRFAAQLLPGPWDSIRRARFLLLALPVSVNGIWSGQSNALILALACLGLCALAEQKWNRAAALLAGPVYIKIWPIVLSAMVMPAYCRRLLPRFCGACLCLAVLPFATRPWNTVVGQYQNWWIALTGPLQARWPGYRDLWTVWEGFHPPVDAVIYKSMQLFSLAVALGWTWRRAGKATGHSWLAEAAGVWAVWQLLVGPGSERLTYGLAAPLLADAMLKSFEEGRCRVLACAAWVTTSAFSIGDFEKSVLTVLPVAKALLPLGILLTLLWCVAWERGSARQGSQAAVLLAKSQAA